MHPFCQKIVSGYQPEFQEIIDEFSSIFPLLEDLIKTPQDPEWHAEGNVYIHTSMVLNELYRLINDNESKLTPDQVLTLVLSVALHDIAKPFTTREIEIQGVQRIAAPKHEYKGASYIAYKIQELDLPFQIAYGIISLVAYHIMPKLLVVKNAPSHQYRKLSRLVDMELLYYLEKADMMGRTCRDQNSQIENIEMFKIFAQEYNVWNNKEPYKEWKSLVDNELSSYPLIVKRFALASTIKDAEEGLICTPEEGVARSYSYRDSFSELVILCGPSGSGKSTWVKNNSQDYEVISLDKIRKELTGSQSDQSKNGQVIQAAKKTLKTYLAKKKNVIWDATNLRKDFRSQIADLGYDYNALVIIVWFYEPISTFYAQDKNRKEQVGSKVLDRQLDYFEWPELWESHIFKVIDCKGNILLET